MSITIDPGGHLLDMDEKVWLIMYRLTSSFTSLTVGLSVVAGLLVTLGAAPMPAQTLHISGAVTDTSNARVRAATVTLACAEQPVLQTYTDSDGRYEFHASGQRCTLKVSAAGFAIFTQQVAAENVNEHNDMILPVQQVSNSVTVSAESGYVAVASATATKTDTPIAEVPQAISVITRDQMDEQGIQTVPEALRYSAGVIPELRGISGDAYETIEGRGFSMEEYLDGLRLPNSGAGFLIPSFDPTGLERIEILHGPASVLFGQAYPAGLVNLVSKQPRAESSRMVEFTPGEYNRLQGDWDFTGPFDQAKHFLYRLTGVARDKQSQVDYNEEERYFIAPSVTWHPDEKTSLTMLFDYQYDPHVGFYNLLPAAGTVLANPYGVVPTSFDPGEPSFDKHQRRQYAGGYLFTRSLGSKWSIQQNLRFFRLQDNQKNTYTSDLEADNRTLDRYSFINDEHIDATTLDTHASTTVEHGGLRQTILMGVDYQSLPFEEAYGFDFSAPTQDMYNPTYHVAIATPAYAGDDHVKFWQAGTYGQDQARYKRLAFTVGGREDWTNTEDHEKISGSDTKQSDHAFTGRAGVVYLAGSGVSPYFSYSTSFQPSIGTDYNGNTFKPTTGQQYEVGLKYQPAKVNAFVTISAFNLSEQNVSTTDAQHPQFSTQAGAVRSRGIEVETHANLSRGWSVVGAYSYLDNVVTQSNDTDAAFGINKGKTFYGTPVNTASFWTDYSPRVRALSGLNIGSGVRFIGRTFGDDTDDFTVPFFTLVDATAHYNLRTISTDKYHWQISIRGSNLADHRYVSTCIDAAAGCFYGARRDVMGSVGLKW